MSDEQDRDSKTEEPSEKRLQDSRDKGEVPFSREVPVLLSLAAIAAALIFCVNPAAGRIAVTMRVLLSEAGTRHLDNSNDVLGLLGPVAGLLAIALLPTVSLLMLAGILSPLVQNPFSLIIDRIAPKASRLSPRQGLKRLFGSKALVEFVKSFIKFAGLGLISVLVIRAQLPDMLQGHIRPAQTIPNELRIITLRLVETLTIAALLLAVADMLWSRFSWRRDLRMTRQEVKEEHRQSEGDPLIRRRQQMQARARAARRMMTRVPQATLIVTNPTHFAVALRYDRNVDAAPMVVAKGLDLIALRIREIGEEHAVPIIENRPLARALYEKVEIDSMIPPEFFRAVAELIHFLNMRAAHS